ncbi:MAG: trypsin-like serine protease [Desulfobacteraceae bacterium]|nr:trypsin-like serine protease [Desulfobacteraceae bacterium]
MVSRSSNVRCLFSCRYLVLSAVCAIFAVTGGFAGASENVSDIRQSVFRIYAVSQIADYLVPWDPGRTESSTGTGFLIADGLILTNAHVASNARLITVEKEGDARRFEARVKYIAHDCDLALLELLDSSFLNGLTPLKLGSIPELDSTVSALGYPIGGDRLSITRGVVSRIDYQTYSHSGIDSHLVIQVDAAINPGNSGGPVIQDNRVVGVAFQSYSGIVAQNVGYMIPVPVINRFLHDVRDGHYDSYVDLGIQHFPLINSVQRRALGLAQGDNGVMVTVVNTAGAAAGILETGDVLLSIDGLPVFSDGHVELDGDRVLLHEVVERKFKGDTVSLSIFRRTRKMDVKIPLNSPWPYQIQANRHDVRPRFVLYGGIVFQPLSRAFLAASKTNNVDTLYHYEKFIDNDIFLEKPEVILISKVLPDPITAELHGFVHSIVEQINDIRIKTLEDVAAAFKLPVDYHIIRLMGNHRPIVLEQDAVEFARKRILQRYGIGTEEYLEDSIVPADWLEKRGN